MKTIEIFKPGTHTDHLGRTIRFTGDAVKAIALAYSAETSEAPLVVGHPAEDHPAYGWVKSLEYSGGVLKATPHQVDAEFSEMVEAGRFKKRSASFYTPDAPSNPTPGQYYLRHVGFLGAAPPAVKGLRDPQFKDGGEGCVTVEFGEWEDRIVPRTFRRLREFIIDKFSREEADEILPEWELEDLDRAAIAKNTEPEPAFADPAPQNKPSSEKSVEPAELAQREQELADKEAAFAESEKAAKARADAFAKREADIARESNAAFLDGLVAEGKLAPAHKEGALSFMAALPTGDDAAKSVAFGEGDARTEQSPAEYFKTFMAAQPKQVSFGEAAGDEEGGDPPTEANDIANEAVAYQEEQRGKGRTVSIVEAVNHITAKGADA